MYKPDTCTKVDYAITAFVYTDDTVVTTEFSSDFKVSYYLRKSAQLGTTKKPTSQLLGLTDDTEENITNIALDPHSQGGEMSCHVENENVM